MLQVEKRAKALCALASKTYICIGLDDTVKISSKGLNKAALMAKDNPYQLFTSVLDTGISQGGTNVGFRVLKDKIYTYNCFRNALPYFYIKRKCITEDGIHTQTYFDLVLDPVPKHFFCLYEDAFDLSLDDQRSIVIDKFEIKTLRQAHCFMKYKASLNFTEDRKKQKKKGNNGRQKRKVGQKSRNNHKVLADIMNTTDAWKLDRIERSIEVEEDFYGQEFDIMFQLVGQKINKYPDMVESLRKAGNNYIANTCRYNSRLGCGVSPGEARYRSGGFLNGTNILGKVMMSYAIMLTRTLSGQD